MEAKDREAPKSIEIQGSRIDALLQLGAVSLFLATVELLIPKPMPFLKIGIANLPLLLFVRELAYHDVLLLVFLKVFLQSLIAGTTLSYILVFSACASLVSSTAMWFLGKVSSRHVSLLGISILGAASSNGVQLFLALSYFFPGTGSLLIPWSFSFGLGSGALLGLFALRFQSSSVWFVSIQAHLHRQGHSEKDTQGQSNIAGLLESQAKNGIQKAAQNAVQNGYNDQWRFGFGLLSLALMFTLERLEPLYLALELVLFLVLNVRIGYRLWWRPMLILFLFLLFFHLLLPSGRVLWQLVWGPLHWNLTQGALERGLGKALFLLCLIQISRSAVSSSLRLPGRLGQMIQTVFTYYEGLLNSPVRFEGTKPFSSLNAILEQTKSRKPGSMQEIKGQARYLAVRWLFLALLLQIALVVFAYYWPLYHF